MREEENFLVIRDLAEVTIPLFAIVDVGQEFVSFFCSFIPDIHHRDKTDLASIEF